MLLELDDFIQSLHTLDDIIHTVERCCNHNNKLIFVNVLYLELFEKSKIYVFSGLLISLAKYTHVMKPTNMDPIFNECVIKYFT